MRQVLPSAYNIITSNRSIGYTMDSAIADIIDNSISAEATEIDIITPPNPNAITCYICDNGFGMDLLDLDNAMTFGGRDYIKNRKTTDLGRYGLGLKTASLSQCKRFSVVTKKKGEHLIGGCWDLDLVKDHNEWKYLVLSDAECLEIIKDTPLVNYDSGTVVLWEKFDRLEATSGDQKYREFTQLIANTQNHMELVFHRYLVGEKGIRKLAIRVNNRVLEPNDPFLGNTNPSVVEPIVIPIENDTVTVYPHKLVHPSRMDRTTLNRLEIKGTLLNTQGFYVYRNKRLLIWGTWFGLAHKTDKTKLCRIQIDIPNSLDHLWSLDIKKSNAIPPAFIKDRLRAIIMTVSDISVRTFRQRATPNKNKTPYWLRMISEEKFSKYQINIENPLIKAFQAELNEKQASLFLDVLQNIETFLPIAQINFDLQRDYSIENEIDSESKTLAELEVLFEKYLNLGLSAKSLLMIEPFCNNPEFVELKEKNR